MPLISEECHFLVGISVAAGNSLLQLFLLIVPFIVGWAVFAFLGKIFRSAVPHEARWTAAFFVGLATFMALDYAASPTRFAQWPKKATVEELQNNLININTATREQLELVPGIGRATSRRIIDGRPWKRIEDVARLPGLRKDKWESISRCITVGGVAPRQKSLTEEKLAEYILNDAEIKKLTADKKSIEDAIAAKREHQTQAELEARHAATELDERTKRAKQMIDESVEKRKGLVFDEPALKEKRASRAVRELEKQAIQNDIKDMLPDVLGLPEKVDSETIENNVAIQRTKDIFNVSGLIEQAQRGDKNALAILRERRDEGYLSGRSLERLADAEKVIRRIEINHSRIAREQSRQQRERDQAIARVKRAEKEENRVQATIMNEQAVAWFIDNAGKPIPITAPSGGRMKQYDKKSGVVFDEKTGKAYKDEGGGRIREIDEDLDGKIVKQGGHVYSVVPGMNWKWQGLDPSASLKPDKQISDAASDLIRSAKDDVAIANREVSLIRNDIAFDRQRLANIEKNIKDRTNAIKAQIEKSVDYNKEGLKTIKGSPEIFQSYPISLALSWIFAIPLLVGAIGWILSVFTTYRIPWIFSAWLGLCLLIFSPARYLLFLAVFASSYAVQSFGAFFSTFLLALYVPIVFGILIAIGVGLPASVLIPIIGEKLTVVRGILASIALPFTCWIASLAFAFLLPLAGGTVGWLRVEDMMKAANGPAAFVFRYAVAPPFAALAIPGLDRPPAGIRDVDLLRLHLAALYVNADKLEDFIKREYPSLYDEIISGEQPVTAPTPTPKPSENTEAEMPWESSEPWSVTRERLLRDYTGKGK